MKADCMQYPFFGTNIYWRFKGKKEYRYGYPIRIDRNLVKMGRWNGDIHGPVVDFEDIEVKR